ncbi:TetR family transcriptional regulator [Rhodopirellula maiorica SM1]|uniref:TetR family transcriptional regulator n=1 Tax=Rhodopirellula maiorica SM1 TaxID=1265738 RepID=M5RM68_9BACT|nr:TetR family transcriptional regulator [Rhodopirellula maiorica]EMI20395.1 TetR family transcriptional regulator [Rhodopirellula maiorica SM1]
MNWQRARRPAQKAERMNAILDAAASLFDEKELSEISMRDVAERAGVGKASLYHYVKTKEEVFLSLYGHELEVWLEGLEKRLGRLRKPTPERVAAALVDELKLHPRLCRLKVVLSLVLERNLSDEAIAEFKESLLGPTDHFVAMIHQSLPQLSHVAAKDFLFQYHALVAGLWPMAHPTKQLAAIIREAKYSQFRVDFYALLQRTLVTLLQSKEKGSQHA